MLAIERLYHTVKAGGRPIPSRLSRWRALAQTIGRRAEQLKKLDDRQLLQATGGRLQEMREQQAGQPTGRHRGR